MDTCDNTGVRLESHVFRVSTNLSAIKLSANDLKMLKQNENINLRLNVIK
jgi:hypothetical protein